MIKMKPYILLVLCVGIISTNAMHTSESKAAISPENLSAIFDAIKAGNADRVGELIKDHNVNTANDLGRTPLHVAIEAGNDKIAELLIQNDACIHKRDKEGVSPPHFAALNNDEKILDLLGKKEPDVNYINRVDNSGNTPLHLAALNNNEKVVEFLLNHGADVTKINNDNETVLHWSTANSNEKVAELLIKKGLNLESTNNINLTPLHTACLNSNDKIAELLIKSGANVNAEDKDSWTPIFFAVVNGNEKFKEQYVSSAAGKSYTSGKAIEYLVKHWTNPIQERAGDKIAELLLSNGADVNHKDKNEMTPCQLAAEDPKMVEILKKHDAKC